MSAGKRLSPIGLAVRKISPNVLTSGDVAELLGVSQTTLGNIVRSGEVKAPSKWQQMGSSRIGVYSKTDVEELRAYLKERHKIIASPDRNRRKVGAPKQFTKTQVKERRRLTQRVFYHSKQAKTLWKAGERKKSAEHKAKAAEYQQKLDSMPRKARK
jgi:hypothetical protein